MTLTQDAHLPLHPETIHLLSMSTEIKSLVLTHHNHYAPSTMRDLQSLSSLSNLSSLFIDQGRHGILTNIEDEAVYISSLTKLTKLTFRGVFTVCNLPHQFSQLKNLKSLELLVNCNKTCQHAFVTIPPVLMRASHHRLIVSLYGISSKRTSFVSIDVPTLHNGTFTQTFFHKAGMSSSSTSFSPILEHAHSWIHKNVKVFFLDLNPS